MKHCLLPFAALAFVIGCSDNESHAILAPDAESARVSQVSGTTPMDGVTLEVAFSSAVIHACAHNQDGMLRLVAAGATCRSSESPISWNVAGPTGPQGETGETGPQGEQGPAGPSGLSGYEVVGEAEFDNVAVVHCPEGKRAVGGGGSAELHTLRSSRPLTQGTGWRTERSDDAPGLLTTAVAICVDEP